MIEPDGRFQSSVAGHPPILHVRADGTLVNRIGKGAYPLGIRSSLSWAIEEGVLADGESLVLYSDGLVEARGVGDLEYGYERAERVLSFCVATDAASKLAAVLADWNSFMDQKAIDDDVSIAVIQKASEPIA